MSAMQNFTAHRLNKHTGEFVVDPANPKTVDGIMLAARSGVAVSLTVFSQSPDVPRLPLTPETFSVRGRITEVLRSVDAFGGVVLRGRVKA